jgi:hypothetical protein
MVCWVVLLHTKHYVLVVAMVDNTESWSYAPYNFTPTLSVAHSHYKQSSTPLKYMHCEFSVTSLRVHTDSVAQTTV